jgi:glutathione-regulated potassium-efflux system ancillary protein KefC
LSPTLYTMSAELALMLAVTVTGGLLSAAIRMPPLVGFLGAGFALAAMGVAGNSTLDAVADLGVTLLLFAIGLKLDARTLLRREVAPVTLAHTVLSVLAALGLLAVAAQLGLGLLTDASLGTLALVALLLSFSSTVVAVKLLDQKHASQSLYGRTAIGILVIQDLIAVVVIVVASGEMPSWWALGLVLLLPLRKPVGRALEWLEHGELIPLVAVTLALVPGYALFDAVGLKGDLGALAVGMLLAGTSRADEMSKSLFSVKELLLVAFFVSVGLHGTPTLQHFGIALLLMVLVPIQGLLYAPLLRWCGFRIRTATHAGVALATFSEFALVVGVVVVENGTLDEQWITVLSTAVAMSFVVSALLSRRTETLARIIRAAVPRLDPDRLHPEDRLITVGHADVVVLGMGRLGCAVYHHLVEEYGLQVLGVESDSARVRTLVANGRDVIEGDATDPLFWERVKQAGSVQMAILAMPFHGSNMAALRELELSKFNGSVAAVARFEDELSQLTDSVDAVLGLYEAAGRELADQAVESSGLADGLR